MPDFAAIRRRMADRIARRGVRDQNVLEALKTIPREAFVEPTDQSVAYEDRPLPIAEHQTISQPFMVALMLEAAELTPQSRVLEIGAGSGYAAALMGHMAHEVHSVERFASLADQAHKRLTGLGIANVTIHHGDGITGWPDRAPYDAIIVAAAPEAPPSALLDQLAPGGRLIIPIGPEHGPQLMMKYVKQPDGSITERDLGEVRFVPLLPGSD